MKIKMSKNVIIIICSVVLLIIFGAYCFDYIKKGEIGREVDKYREEERIKREREKEIENAKKLEEYLKNKKAPAEYLSLLKKEKFYFVSYSSESGNGIYEIEIINDVPILYRTELINGEKIKLYDIILDEQFDNPYLPGDRSRWHRLYDCDFAFFTRSSAGKDNLNNIGSYLSIREEDGEIKIWAFDNYSYCGLIYEPQSIENILSTFDNSKKEIQYTGKYIYEKIEITRSFYKSNPNYTPKATTKEIYITYTDTNNLIMYEDDDWRYIKIEDINEPRITLFAADGGGNSHSTYCYFKDDYLIYHEKYHHYNRETLESVLEWDVEYEIYYKKR